MLCLWTPATARPTQVAITRRLANIFTATTPAQAQDDGDSAETGRKLSTSVPQVLFYCGSVDTREAAMAASSSSTETNGILYGSTQHQENVWELTGPNFTHAEHAALAAIGIGGPTLRLHYECSKDGDDNTETFDFLVDKSVGMTCNIYGNATISNIDQAIADEICKSAPKAPEGSADFSVLRISGVDSRTFILFLFAAFLPPPSCVWVRNTSTGVFVQVNLKQGESAMQFREVDTEGTRNSLLQVWCVCIIFLVIIIVSSPFTGGSSHGL